MRELFVQSLRAVEPQRSAAQDDLQQLQNAPITAPILGTVLDMCLKVPNADGTPCNLGQPDSEDSNVRLLAVIWLKQYLKGQWRASKERSLLLDEERAHIRSALLLAALHEPQETVALHLSLIVAMIARVDFPTQWSFDGLFPIMLQPLECLKEAADPIRNQRSVNLCYRVVKELAAKRLMQHRKQFAMLSMEMLPLLMQFWSMTATELNDVLQTQGQAATQTNNEKVATIALSLLTKGVIQLNVLSTATKLISTMLLNAFRDLAALQSGEVMRSVFIEFYNQLERLVRFRQALSVLIENPSGFALTSDSKIIVLALDKCMHRIAVTILGVQKAYPIEFREHLQPYLSFFWNVCHVFAMAPAHASPRQLQIDALQYFANVLACRLYKIRDMSGPRCSTQIISKVITATGDVALTNAILFEAQTEINAFFTQVDNRFASLLKMMVMPYMVLNDKDLAEWRSEPEAFYTVMESLTAQESVRACAENVFLTLVQNYSEQTISALIQMTSDASTYLVDLGRERPMYANTDRRVLDIDAVLVAIGLSCYDLHDCFEFEPWFLTNLVPILVHPDTTVGSFEGLPILRFRIVWLVSCWLAQLSASVRPPIYDALLNLTTFMHEANADVALKLRIIQTLESMLNDWGFEYDAFSPFLARSLECLFALFQQVNESESKMKVLGCLESIIQACGAHIVSFCRQIIAILPALWENESDASNLVRGKVLQLMAKLLSSVNEVPSGEEAGGVEALPRMCVQVIRYATDVLNPDAVFLIEGGLQLWKVTLEVSTMYTEELHVLFGSALRLMERDCEHIVLVLNLLERYLLLGNIQFWQAYHAPISQLFLIVFANVKAEASLLIASVAERIIKTIPTNQLATFSPVVKTMAESCINYKRGRANQERDSVIGGYLSVVARLMVTSLDFSLNTCCNDLAVLLELANVMLRLFYTVGSSSLTPLQRKVWALALLSTLTLKEHSFLDKTGQILDLCAEVIDEEQEITAAVDSDKSGGQVGVFCYKQQPIEQDACILALDLKSFVCKQLNALASNLGSSHFDNLLQTVDASVIRKLYP